MKKKPNVLLIHADQLRFDALGCTGNPARPTPYLDALAAEGTLVTRHMSTNTVCMPSRASLFTGLQPSSHGVWSNGVALNRKEYAEVGVPEFLELQALSFHHELPTIADQFLAHGYRTASVGKLHLTPEYSPDHYQHPEALAFSSKLKAWKGPYYGFEHVVMTKGHGEIPRGHYAIDMEAKEPNLVAAVESNPKDPKPIPELDDLFPSVLSPENHPSQWLANQCCDLVDEFSDSESPFFLYLGIPDPHHPFIPLAEDLEALADAPIS